MNSRINSIYLGDIDPNQEKLLSPLEIRRRMMYQLLIWDSVVLSDSQYLIDPRIRLLMEHYEGPKGRLPGKRGDMGVELRQKGFEELLKAGLVEVAHRQDSEREVYTETRLWNDMHQAGYIRFLPETEHYARYLDTMGEVHRDYTLTSMSGRFKQNLLAGVRSGDLVLSPADETDQHLLRMFHENPVLFRHILDFLKTQRELKAITQERFQEIYDYVYSCYNVNVSAETGCYISAKVNELPLHLDSGAGNFDDPAGEEAQSVLRPTWILAPEVLDIISINDFVSVRKEVQDTIHSGKLVEYITGRIKGAEWKDFRDRWEDYVVALEKCFRECLDRQGKEIADQLAQKGRVTQRKAVFNGAVLVSSLLPVSRVVQSQFQAVTAAAGAFGLGTAVYTMAVDALRRRREEPLWKLRDQIKQLLASDTGIITNYGT